jgi:exopolyphosphatase/guanosine-5'-triphosphate,3'-diphosphate pyrophosphatase
LPPGRDRVHREIRIVRDDEVTTDGTPIGFPVRLGALDVGSNAIRYLLAEFSDRSRWAELESRRFAIRLGRDAFEAGALSPPMLDAAVEAAARFRRRLDDLGITGYRAVATSAVRESRNGGDLARRVRSEAGIDLETIDGAEEARLVWLAVRRRVPLGNEAWILADLGGGSIEVSVIDDGGIRASETHPFGTVRVLTDIATEGHDPAAMRRVLERHVSRLRIPEADDRAIAGTIITGGNAEALALLAGARPNGVGVRELRTDDLLRTLDRLAGLTVAQRVREIGLRPDRADVILPAAVIFERVVHLARADRVLVPGVGVEDGVLIELAENRSGASSARS